MRLVLLVFAGGLLWGQQEPPAEAVRPPAEPARPVIENTGKPMRVPYQCTDEDIRHFGMTCTDEQPCPIFLELSSAAWAAGRLFVTGNLHNGSATMYSVLLVTEDAGKTWFEPHPRIQSAGLEQIQFFDAEAGWVGGQVLQALPRDPFLLVTTDGGRTWRQRAVFSDSKIGAIEAFRFDSRTSGRMVIDRMQSGEGGGRHELYESMTGGESWMISQVSSKPISLRESRVPLPEPDYRVRAQRTPRAYVVERRTAQRFQSVASFLIQTAECRPEPRELLEPPPEPEIQAAPEIRLSPPGAGPRRPPTLKKPR